MFQPGDLVVYGTTGVCRVEAVSVPDMGGTDRSKLYYQLNPLQQDGLIYTPVDNPKVAIRPLISREEAEELIAQIPSIHAEACRAPTLQALAQHYQEALHSGSCLALLQMTMSIYAKKQQAETQKRRLGLVDERCLKQAERLLHGELAAVLGIPFEDVPAYIAEQLNTDTVC